MAGFAMKEKMEGKSTSFVLQRKNRFARQANLTGIPAQLKERLEESTGLSLDDVRVHYNSDLPARLDALAYTQGNRVEIGPGQERHLPHELGHVVQQKLGTVRANAMHASGVALNTDASLERQADEIGAGKRVDIVQRMGDNVVQRQNETENGDPVGNNNPPGGLLALPAPGDAPAAPVEVSEAARRAALRRAAMLRRMADAMAGNFHQTVDPLTGIPVGRFVGDTRGNWMIEPVGGRTIAYGNHGDVHTLYPNGSNYQRFNPKGHLGNPTPHIHAHLMGTGPGRRGQGPSLDVNGNVVNFWSPAAHWPVH